MIHFFHEVASEDATPELIEEVVKEQCRCWFHLNHLLKQWGGQFSQYEERVTTVHWQITRMREYLSVAFDRLRPQIEIDKNTGSTFHMCSGCGYEAAEVRNVSDVLFEKTCRVCGLIEGYAEINCPSECGQKIHIKAEHGSKRTCDNCGFQVAADELSELLSTEFLDPVDYVQINCALCMSAGSVVQHGEIYVCSECLSMANGLASCEWCSELQMGGGDLEFSYHSGCEFCDGHAEWVSSE